MHNNAYCIKNEGKQKNIILMRKMEFITDAGEKVMRTMNDNMVYFNLPPCMIEYWNYTIELNRTLADLVEFLALDHHSFRCRLNPAAALHVPTTIASINEDTKLNENKENDAPWKTIPSKE